MGDSCISGNCYSTKIMWNRLHTEQAAGRDNYWEVSVVGADGRPHPYPNCAHTTEMQCLIEYRDLQDYPWNLVVDTPVQT